MHWRAVAGHSFSLSRKSGGVLSAPSLPRHSEVRADSASLAPLAPGTRRLEQIPGGNSCLGLRRTVGRRGLSRSSTCPCDRSYPQAGRSRIGGWR
eukprot:2931840-Rhodomonas_salina.2